MGNPGVKDKLARTKTLTLSLPCTCASVQTSRLPILQPHIQPVPLSCSISTLTPVFTCIGVRSVPFRLCFPRPVSSSAALTPAYTGSLLGTRQEESTWPDRTGQDAEDEAAEADPHPRCPPKEVLKSCLGNPHRKAFEWEIQPQTI